MLTDDNPPAIHEVKSNGAYTACLLAISKPDEDQKPNGKGKAPAGAIEPDPADLSSSEREDVKPGSGMDIKGKAPSLSTSERSVVVKPGTGVDAKV